MNQYKLTNKIVRRAIAKDNAKDHPLMWTDYNAAFNGDYVKTTPTMVSIVEQIRGFIVNNPEIVNQFSTRNDPTGIGAYKQGKIKVTGIQYQLRYQQNDAAENVGADTVRNLLYSFTDTYNENTNAVLDGGDVDQAPNTMDIKTMYWDRICYLKAAITETATDDSQFVPGQKIYKGFVRLGQVFTFNWIDSSSTLSWEQNDIRFEHQSDDNSLIGEVQVYGYMRIYFRVIS